MDAKGRGVSLTEAAALLGLHRNTLARWLDQGCPARRQADRARGIEWEIGLGDVVDWLVERAKTEVRAAFEQIGGQSVDIEEAKRRRALAAAIIAETEADEVLKLVVAVADVVDIVGSEYGALRSKLSGLGAKVAGRAATLTDPVAIQELIDTQVREALEALQYDRRLGADSTPQEG